MSGDTALVLRLSIIFIPLLLVTGFYCILATRNLIRALIGLEILTKAVTLLIIVAGYVTGRLALAQTLVITLIVFEVVVMVVAAGLIVNVFKHFDSLDVRNLRNLKG
jgi:NADH-quinone oxidoreductase subunit K